MVAAEAGVDLADGDKVVAEWEADGTAAGGGHYANRCLGIFTVAQGRITSVKEYLDTKHAAEVLFPQRG
jgi:ketosteroid isomerase-like protein